MFLDFRQQTTNDTHFPASRMAELKARLEGRTCDSEFLSVQALSMHQYPYLSQKDAETQEDDERQGGTIQ